MAGAGGGGSCFVGREQLLSQIVRDLEPGHPLRADGVSGALGMGKTSLLRRIRDLADESAFHSVLLDLTMYEPGYTGGSSAELTTVGAVRNFDALKAVAHAVVEQVNPDLLERIHDAARAAWVPVLEVQAQNLSVSNVMTLGDHASVGDSGQTSSMSGFDSAAAYEAARIERILSAGLALSDALIDCLNDVTRTRPLLLLIDNIDRVAETAVGGWLLRVVQCLTRAVVVLTHEPGRDVELPAGLGQRVRIPPLSLEEVAEYLERLRLEDGDPAELAALVHQSSGGVPVAVALLVDLLTDRSTDLTAAHLTGRFDLTSSDAEGRIARVVATMVERLEGKVVGSALRAVSITDACDATLLAKLLAGMGHDDVDIPEVMKELEAFSFTDELRDGTGYHVQVHPFIAKGLVDSMAHYDPQLLTRLHDIAARHYFEQITTGTDYGEMFSYEKPEQQWLRRRWLRQFAHAHGARACVEVAMVYFDAFWWWGNYVQFDFCDALAEDIADLAAESGDARLGEFADALRRFGRHYPYRAKHRRVFENRRPSADWEQVREALYEVLDHCALLDGTPEASPDASPETAVACHVAALVDIFLAHSHRYEGSTDLALENYDLAAGLLRDLDEEWDLAWVLFERADTVLEAGRADEALAGLAESASVYTASHQDPVDEELLANLHRLRADCLWLTSDHEAAMREYAVAVMHAYLFHRTGGPPDDYTMQYYFELRGRALERLLALPAIGGREAVVDAIGAMTGSLPATARWPRPDAEQLADTLEQLSLLDLAHQLFPRGPHLDELGLDRSPFMTEMRPRVQPMLRALADDLPLAATRSDDSPSPR